MPVPNTIKLNKKKIILIITSKQPTAAGVGV